MNNTWRALLFSVGFPVIAAALAWACLVRIDSDVRDAVHKRQPTLTADQLERVTVPLLFEENAINAESDVVGMYSRIKLARDAGIAIAALGLALFGTVVAAGRITRTHRDLLLRLFRPGLYIMLIAVGILTAVQAVASSIAVYYFESIFVGRVHFILIVGVAIGGLLAFVAVVRALWSLRIVSSLDVIGSVATRAEQPGIWRMVDQVCAQLGAQPPDNVVVGLEPTYYVTESPVKLAEQELTGRTLFVSTSFSRLLTPAELSAVIGHETAHFIGEDTTFSRSFFPVYRGTRAAIVYLARNAVHSSLALAQLPAIAFLGFFHDSFATSEKNVSRIRETAADAVGARVGGADALASALVKIHAHGDAWGKVIEDLRFDAAAVKLQPNLALRICALAQETPASEMAKAGERHQSHPMDSHPTLTQRLSSLGTDLTATMPRATVPNFPDSAAALFSNIEPLELTQSQQIRLLVRPQEA